MFGRREEGPNVATEHESTSFSQSEIPRRRWRYNSPSVQIGVLGVVCFCCPGRFNAINGLGAAGKADARITDNGNTALAVTFATCSLVAGAVFNVVGHRLLLFLGGLTYVLYVGSYLSYAPALVISAGAVLGVGAGFLWAAQGAIMISYPAENRRGRLIGVFWSIFNLGGALGSFIPLVLEWHSGRTSVSVATYVAFMAFMACGSLISLALLPPSRVFRDSGEPVSIHRYSDWKSEAAGIVKLVLDWRMVMLAPMFLASNWFYTYQFNAVNGGLFSTRTRALNGTCYWLVQILGANLMGRALDSPALLGRSRRARAQAGLGVLLTLSSAIWGGGLAFQLTFTRESAARLGSSEKMDLAGTGRYAGPAALFACYGLFDAAWQTYCYWIMGALAGDDPRGAARMSGLYKAVQNAGAALAGQMDARRLSFLHQLIVNWALLSLGCASAAVVATRAVMDSPPITALPPGKAAIAIAGGNSQASPPHPSSDHSNRAPCEMHAI